MKSGLKYLLVIGLCVVQAFVCAQVTVEMMKDSIDKFWQERKLMAFFEQIKVMGDSALAWQDYESLKEAGQYLFREYENLSKEELFKLRSTAMYTANKISKLQKRFDEALPYYLIANEKTPNKEMPDSLAWFIENAIANIYTRLGDGQKADYFQAIVQKSLLNSIKIGDNPKPYLERLARLYSDRGNNLITQGLKPEALLYYEKGYNLADSLGFAAGIFTNGIHLSEYESERKNFSKAEFYLAKAGSVLPQLENRPRYFERLANYEFQHALVFYRKGLFKESIQFYKKAIQTLEKAFSNPSRREFGKFYNKLAEVYFSLDSFDIALKFAKKGLTTLVPEYVNYDELPQRLQIYHDNTFMELFGFMAKVNESKYFLTSDTFYLGCALKCIELGLFSNDLIRDEVLTYPSKLITLSDNKSLVLHGIDINYKLYSISNNQAYLDNARILFTKSKGVLLREKAMRNHIRTIMMLGDQDSLKIIENSILELYRENQYGSIDHHTFITMLLSLREQESFIYDRYQNINLSEYKIENYIEYALGHDDLFAIAKLNGRQHFEKLGTRSKVIELIERMNVHLQLKNYSIDEIVLHELYTLLIFPFENNLTPYVTIVPDAEISFIPFDILQDSARKYLIEKSTISITYDFEQYSFSSNTLSDSFNIICVIPEYENNENLADQSSRGSLGHLKYSMLEAEAIISIYGDSVRLSTSELKDDLISNYLKSSIFHFAGHAIVKENVAYLALGNSDESDQRITTGEISLVYHPSRLVVLSACETGLGTLELGEGIKSLGRSFFESGAESTVISLWNVNDKSTSAIMVLFYKNLKRGMRKDDALREAKLRYLSNAEANERHPYYWAAFIPSGNMQSLEQY